MSDSFPFACTHALVLGTEFAHHRLPPTIAVIVFDAVDALIEINALERETAELGKK